MVHNGYSGFRNGEIEFRNPRGNRTTGHQDIKTFNKLAVIDGIIKILESGAVFDWSTLNPVVIAGIRAALSYLLKSLMTNSHNQLFRKEPA